jgi:hypothetical protein
VPAISSVGMAAPLPRAMTAIRRHAPLTRSWPAADPAPGVGRHSFPSHGRTALSSLMARRRPAAHAGSCRASAPSTAACGVSGPSEHARRGRDARDLGIAIRRAIVSFTPPPASIPRAPRRAPWPKTPRAGGTTGSSCRTFPTVGSDSSDEKGALGLRTEPGTGTVRSPAGRRRSGRRVAAAFGRFGRTGPRLTATSCPAHAHV